MARKKPSMIRHAIILGLGAALLLASFALDGIVSDWVSSSPGPVLDYFFGWVSYALTVLVVLVVMTSMFMWEEDKKDWIPILWLSLIITAVLVFIVKFIVQRDRPGDIVHEILGLTDYSFPSAHAAAAFSAIAILDEEYPYFKWFWIGFALLVAASRVYLGVHYLSDVVAGALIGYAIGLALTYMKKKHSWFSAGW